jgi:Fur family ferric uptake transcriptional regulator
MENGSQSTLVYKLSSKGVRLTRQRRILLDVIETAKEHLHASDLLRLARQEDDRIDRATVYRTLALLKEEGLVEELDLLHLDGSEHHYELRDGTGHVHVGCKRCGKILEFKTELLTSLADEIRRATGCDVDSVKVEVSALCPACKSTE